MSTQGNATVASSGAAIPTVIECNPTGTSPPAGVRLSYFGEKSVAEVTACLAQGSQPMLVGCTADTIDMVVKCPLHGHRASMPVRVADSSGRMTVGYFCKHFSTAFIAMMRQCVYCAQVPVTETFLICLEYVGGTTVEVVMDCPRVRTAMRARAAAMAAMQPRRAAPRQI
ncbi:hypothetical protein FOMPIDRAFT_1052742 [Fomitopsis schrenkii]|uniref:Uncharacterized protein n=1 Tax=Fomitopsis schrenkii TaxID=2126942 RepID=S8FF62_FOMSC|nr:hypothetical protein FOMPIDRAFT_1052742 [Fomitopsis schrenkii]